MLLTVVFYDECAPLCCFGLIHVMLQKLKRTNQSFPPDEEVPCAVVCCGKKFLGPESIKQGEDFAFPKMPPPSAQSMDRKSTSA